MSGQYTINKGINKPVEFKGLKAQYIWYLGAGLIALLIFFAILYISGVNPFLCVGITILLATAMFMHVYRLSRTYGPHGMVKKVAGRSIPKAVEINSRLVFISLRKKDSSAIIPAVV